MHLANALISRVKCETTFGGSLRWWKFANANDDDSSWYYNTKIRDLEATAFALLGLGKSRRTREERLFPIRWITMQQNENGGFFSTSDTVTALRALTAEASDFPAPSEVTPITTEPTGSSQQTANVSQEN